MAYENDGQMGYVLTITYDAGPMGIVGDKIYGDREQVQAHAACLAAKATARGLRQRFGVAGIAPISDVPIGSDYTGPFHSLNDACETY